MEELKILKTGKIVNLDRINNINQQYGTYNHIKNKTIWIELTGVVEYNKVTIPDTFNEYNNYIKSKINFLLKQHQFFNEKNVLNIDCSVEQIINKQKAYYTLQLILLVKENILYKDINFHNSIINLISEINELISNDNTFKFLESKLR